MPNSRSLRLLALFGVVVFAVFQISRGETWITPGDVNGIKPPAVSGAVETAPKKQPKPPVIMPPLKPIKFIAPGSVASPPNVYFPVPSEREVALLEKLEESIELNFTDTLLVDMLAYVSEYSEITLHLQKAEKEEMVAAGTDPDNTVVTYQIAEGKVPLRTALDQMLSPIGARTIVEDGVLIITSIDASEKRHVTRVYPVGDLTDSHQPETYAELVNVIRAGTGGAWEDQDEEGGRISMSRTLRALVIHQTRHTHDEIVELLTALRAARDVE